MLKAFDRQPKQLTLIPHSIYLGEYIMSLYLKELNELDGFLTLRQSIDQEEWQAGIAALSKLPDGNRFGELLKLVEQMGATHLEAIREFEKVERDKGCIPTYLRQFCPV